MKPARARGTFATTHWSLVLAAARDQDLDGRRALESLCEQYWYPLYVFIRRRGYGAEDAQDLTQAFFARLLETGDVARASPTRGRFRSFLLAALQNFLRNEFDRVRAVKRGGRVDVSSIDMADAERRYAVEPIAAGTPDDHFNLRWALVLLDRAVHRTSLEYERLGRSVVFKRLVGLLLAPDAVDSCRQAAADLGMTEGAVKVTLHRIRKCFRENLRDLISQTVDEDDLDAEIAFLIAAVSRPAPPR